MKLSLRVKRTSNGVDMTIVIGEFKRHRFTFADEAEAAAFIRRVFRIAA